MKPQVLNPLIGSCYEHEPPAHSLRRLVGKSALLNAVIVLTSGPVLIYEGGPKAVIPTLEIMAGISVLIWTATFALFSLLSLPRIFVKPESCVARRELPDVAEETGVSDRWLDGPV
jgi:hypothetical protein